MRDLIRDPLPMDPDESTYFSNLEMDPNWNHYQNPSLTLTFSFAPSSGQADQFVFCYKMCCKYSLSTGDGSN